MEDGHDSLDRDPLLTVNEVAALLRVSNMTVYRLIRAKRLAAIRVGTNFRIRRSAVARYIEAATVTRASREPL